MPGSATDPAPDTCVAKVPMFRSLTGEQQLQVAGFARETHLRDGERLISAGSNAGVIAVLHSGRLKVARTSAEGREHTLRFLGEGDVVGESALLTGRPATDDVTAMGEVTACVFDAAAIEGILARHPQVGLAMLRTTTERLVAAERLLSAITSADVGTRVAAYLLDLPAARDHDGRMRVHFPVPKKDVASLLGTTPETLSRRLADLQRRGVVELDGPREVIVLDSVALETAAGPEPL